MTRDALMASESALAADEAQIRTLIETRAQAVRTKDITTMMDHVAPDILSFDVVNPLQYSGADAVRTRAEAWFAAFDGPIGYEVRDLRIVAGHDIAFTHSLSRVSGTQAGVAIDMWLRSTYCFRRTGDRWIITHQHSSVPFDVGTGKASLDLMP